MLTTLPSQDSFSSKLKECIELRITEERTTNAMDVIQLALENAESMIGIRGVDKKEVVLKALNDATILSLLPVPVITHLIYMLNNNIIDTMIDVVVDSSNGKVAINRQQEEIGCSIAAIIPKLFECLRPTK